MCQPCICLFLGDIEHAELCNKDYEHQEQACYSNVRERSNHLWINERKGFVEIGKLVLEGADLEGD